MLLDTALAKGRQDPPRRCLMLAADTRGWTRVASSKRFYVDAVTDKTNSLKLINEMEVLDSDSLKPSPYEAESIVRLQSGFS
jgi:hypothetical protein